LSSISSQRDLPRDDAARSATTPIESLRDRHVFKTPGTTSIVRWLVSPGSVNSAFESMRVSKLADKYRATARMLLEPWTVEAALLRLGDRHLSSNDQKIVLAATRTRSTGRTGGLIRAEAALDDHERDDVVTDG
jgi:hypothetical protein